MISSEENPVGRPTDNSPDGFVSIIMPAFNAADTVGDAIESVKGQSYKNWELIIVNDGSTDETEDVLAYYTDDRIHVITTENRGVSAARNRALAVMKGSFFCMLDADDTLPPRSIEARLKLLLDNDEVCFVDGIMVRTDSTMSVHLSEHTPAFRGNPTSELIMMTGSCFSGLTWMIRRRDSWEYRFDETIGHGEDLLFYIGIGDHGVYDHVKEPVLFYRQGFVSAMDNIDGILHGYMHIHEILKRDLSKTYHREIHSYERKVRLIMFRTYLKRGRIIAALRSLLLFR